MIAAAQLADIQHHVDFLRARAHGRPRSRRPLFAVVLAPSGNPTTVHTFTSGLNGDPGQLRRLRSGTQYGFTHTLAKPYWRASAHTCERRPRWRRDAAGYGRSAGDLRLGQNTKLPHRAPRRETAAEGFPARRSHLDLTEGPPVLYTAQ